MMKTMSFTKYSIVVAMTLMLAGCVVPQGSRVSPYDLQKRQQAMASSDRLIVPGQRIGPIYLGMGMDQVVATLGQPDYVTVPPHTGLQLWKYDNLNLGIYCYGNSSAPSVTSIETVAWNDTGKNLGQSTWADVIPVATVFQTNNGIGLGASTYDVRRAYSDYGYQDSGYGMNYTQLGVYFGMQSDRRISVITVTSRQ
jgi:hypothetical protein